MSKWLGKNKKLERAIFFSRLSYEEVAKRSGINVWKLRDAREGRPILKHQRKAIQKVLGCSKSCFAPDKPAKREAKVKAEKLQPEPQLELFDLDLEETNPGMAVVNISLVVKKEDQEELINKLEDVLSDKQVTVYT